jgi:hypothetical protein
MSVRSDVPPSVSTSKQFKTSNQSQRQDYNSSSHYSQRNDFYTEPNDSTWGNDDDYYDDETGYYDPNISTHQRHYQSHLHHRGYIALGSYGRYRRGGSGTLRHQQQYNTYNMNNTSSQLNTSAGTKTKKTVTNRTSSITNKKPDESLEQPKTVIEPPAKVVIDDSVKKPIVWAMEPKVSIVEEVPVIKSNETETITTVTPVIKNENESTVVPQSETEPIVTTKKTSTNNSQRKINKDQQNYYQNQQAPRHRNTYGHAMQGESLTSFLFIRSYFMVFRL